MAENESDNAKGYVSDSNPKRSKDLFIGGRIITGTQSIKYGPDYVKEPRAFGLLGSSETKELFPHLKGGTLDNIEHENREYRIGFEVKNNAIYLTEAGKWVTTYKSEKRDAILESEMKFRKFKEPILLTEIKTDNAMELARNFEHGGKDDKKTRAAVLKAINAYEDHTKSIADDPKISGAKGHTWEAAPLTPIKTTTPSRAK